MINSVIVGFARSPFARALKGPLQSVRPDDMVSAVIESTVCRSRINTDDLEDVMLGCAFPEAAQGNNIARIASLLAGLPHRVGGITLNRFCGSSMSAVHMACGQIAMGAGQLFFAGGVESMSTVPLGGRGYEPNPRLEQQPGTGPLDHGAVYVSMGRTAENVAALYGISRDAQDKLALDSHIKAARARAAGFFKDEIIPIVLPDGGLISEDTCIRPETSLDSLGLLLPAFDDHGTVTAGTAAPLTDGAAVLAIASEPFASTHNLPVLARVRACAVTGCTPALMGIGPVGATRAALSRAGLRITDIDVFELNEAFASQVLACVSDLGLPLDVVNIDGGALALGHPLGATGARIIGHACSIMHRNGGRYAVVTQCVGGGQGVATVLERV